MSSTRPSRLAQSGPSSSSQEGRTNTAISSRRQSRPLIIWQSLKRLFLPKQQTTAGVATTSAKMNRDASSSESTSQVYVVGSPSPNAPYLRIAHISDTCDLPDSGTSFVYNADVIVHSGNLCPAHLRGQLFHCEADLHKQLRHINQFFAAMPHRFKIFVPGPNEAALLEAEDTERIQALLPDCIYLRDSGCVIEGVRFHGVARGSRAGRLGIGRLSSAAEARRAWHNVPDSADVLVCHSLPASSLYEDLVSRLRPKLFLYGRRLRRGSRCSPGHQTGSAENCVKFKDNVIFSNGHAGNGQACRRGVFDFYADESAPRITELSRTRPGF